MKRITKHWKTTVTGIVIGILTVLLWKGQITPTEWIEGFGGVAMIIGLLAKDWAVDD